MEQKESLYSLVAQANSVSQMLSESMGEITPEIEALLTNIDVKLPAKVDGYKTFIDRLEIEAGYWKEKADAFAKVAKAHTTLQSRLKDALKQAMLVMGTDELKGNDYRFKLSNTKPSLEIDAAKLDPRYLIQVTTTEPDKERIRAVLAQGDNIEGAQLVPSVSIRSYLNKKQ